MPIMLMPALGCASRVTMGTLLFCDISNMTFVCGTICEGQLASDTDETSTAALTKAWQHHTTVNSQRLMHPSVASKEHCFFKPLAVFVPFIGFYLKM